jgi:hypothetical protein
MIQQRMLRNYGGQVLRDVWDRQTRPGRPEWELSLRRKASKRKILNALKPRQLGRLWPQNAGPSGRAV